MTNRRSFFKRLLGTAAAITVASAVEVFGITDKIINEGLKERCLKIIVNPEYAKAQYEAVIMYHKSSVMMSSLMNPDKACGIRNNFGDPIPQRFNGAPGNLIEVPYYKVIDYEPSTHDCHE